MGARFLTPVALALAIAVIFSSLARAENPAREVTETDLVVRARLPALILPRVTFTDANLEGALEYFRKKALDQSNGTLKLQFVLDLPADFKPQNELSLEMTKVPLRDALRYLGQLAGVKYTQQGDKLVVQPMGERIAKKAAETQTPSPQGPIAPNSDSVSRSNRLDKTAEKSSAGNNAYRSLDGTLQPDKSGYVEHRSMSGFPTGIDPNNKLDPNCVSPSKCPAGGCGCTVCACKH
jgi:hypothetical protein